MNRLMLRRMITAVLFCSIPAVQAQSADDPWFEIELIAFERGSLNSTLEKFNDSVTPIAVHRSLDLLKPLYQPDIRALYSALPACQPDQRTIHSLLLTELLVFEQPKHITEARVRCFSLRTCGSR